MIVLIIIAMLKETEPEKKTYFPYALVEDVSFAKIFIHDVRSIILPTEMFSVTFSFTMIELSKMYGFSVNGISVQETSFTLDIYSQTYAVKAALITICDDAETLFICSVEMTT